MNATTTTPTATTRKPRATSNDAPPRKPAGPTPAATPAPPAAAADDAEPAPIELGVRLRNRIEKVRLLWRGYMGEFSSMQVSREALCGPFMEGFFKFKEETELGFPNYVQQFDESLSLVRAEYRRHKSFQAADYLRRLYNQKHPKTVTAEERAERAQRVTPTQAMARTLKTILPLISADQVAKLWEMVQAELHWSDRQVENLKGDVETLDPLASLRPLRGAGGSIPQLRIAAPKHEQHEEEQQEAA